MNLVCSGLVGILLRLYSKQMVKPELEVWSSDLKPKRFCKRSDGKNRSRWELVLLKPNASRSTFC